MRKNNRSINEMVKKNLKKSLKEAASYQGNDVDSVMSRLNELSANLENAYDSMQLIIENGKERIKRVIPEFEQEFGDFITGLKEANFRDGVLYLTYGTGISNSEYIYGDEESRFGMLDGATYEYGDGVNYSANTYRGKDGDIELVLELVVLNVKIMSRGMAELFNSIDEDLDLYKNEEDDY